MCGGNICDNLLVFLQGEHRDLRYGNDHRCGNDAGGRFRGCVHSELCFAANPGPPVTEPFVKILPMTPIPP